MYERSQDHNMYDIRTNDNNRVNQGIKAHFQNGSQKGVLDMKGSTKVADWQLSQVVLIGFGAVQKALVTLMLEREKWLLESLPVLIIEPLNID